MDHRSEVETECPAAKIYRVAVFHFQITVGTVDVVESLDHLDCLGVAHNSDVGVSHDYFRYGRRMVRLHMVDHQIVYSAVGGDGIYVVEILAHFLDAYCVNEREFLVSCHDI